MPLQLWLAFVAASTVMLVMPGPTILTVISYSVVYGRHAKFPLVAAVALGDSTALVVSLVGLGALFATSEFWFTAIKGAGGLYLLYLGLRLFFTKTSTAGTARIPASRSRLGLFIHTYLVTSLNPKGVVFFIAFLPQFISPAADTDTQLWILASTFVTLATLNASCYAFFANAARRLLSSTDAHHRFNLAGGSLLSAAGIWALLAQRAV